MVIWSQPIMFLGKSWRSLRCLHNGALYSPMDTCLEKESFMVGRNVLFFSPFQLKSVVSGCSDFHWWERFITYFLERAIFSQVWTFRRGHPKKSLILCFCNLEGKRNLNLPNFPPLLRSEQCCALQNHKAERDPVFLLCRETTESPAAANNLCIHKLTQIS